MALFSSLTFSMLHGLESYLTSVFAACSNLQFIICPHISRNISLIIHLAFNLI